MLHRTLCITRLYHTKNCRGATTVLVPNILSKILYHTKNCRGATTKRTLPDLLRPDYTIPRTVGELQLVDCDCGNRNYYTIPRTVGELQLDTPLVHCFPGLYHTKNCRGATTQRGCFCSGYSLYHTKNCQGATTPKPAAASTAALYHTKNCRGATTHSGRR